MLAHRSDAHTHSIAVERTQSFMRGHEYIIQMTVDHHIGIAALCHIHNAHFRGAGCSALFGAELVGCEFLYPAGIHQTFQRIEHTIHLARFRGPFKEHLQGGAFA